MKTFVFLIFSFLIVSSFAQRQVLEIRGRVAVTGRPNQPIHCFKAKISFNDSLFYETRCDTNGNYKFQLSESFLRNYKTKVSVQQDPDLLRKEFPPDVKCPYLYNGPQRYISPGPLTLSHTPNVAVYEVNFSLNGEACFYPRPLCFSFMKNSTDLQNCDELNGDTTVNCLQLLLNKNPTIVIKILGHAWDEKSPVPLSMRRALYLKNRLVALGADSARIIAEGAGDKMPLITRSSIQKGTTGKSDLETVLSKNRRAEFSIVAFDFDPVDKIRKESPTPPDDMNEE